MCSMCGKGGVAGNLEGQGLGASIAALSVLNGQLRGLGDVGPRLAELVRPWKRAAIVVDAIFQLWVPPLSLRIG